MAAWPDAAVPAAAGAGEGDTEKQYTVKTRCYCGKVRLGCSAEAAHTGSCACGDCKRAHSSLLYTVAYVPIGTVRVLSGRELIKGHFNNADSLREGRQGRFFCTECGSQLFIKQFFGDNHLVGLFHGSFEEPEKAVDGKGWSPFGEGSRHYNTEEQHCTLLREKLNLGKL
jgi:hypothetical protein